MLPGQLTTRFALVRLLGSGGFGRVLLCRDLELDRPVALKLLDLDARSGAIRGRFEREARVTAGLGHPHVIEVYDHGVTDDGQAWIAYAYLPGESLAARVRRSSPAEVEAWARELAAALAAVHRAGIVHRDVKPENVLLRGRGEAVLADFGVARVGETETVYTAEGVLLGTPPYLAPELWRGEAPGPASDQFAWGATFLRVLTGDSPYGADDLAGVLAGLGGYRAPALRGRCGDHARLAEALERSLRARPEQRFPSMDAVRESLGEGTTPSPSQGVAIPAAPGPSPPPGLGETLVVAPRPLTGTPTPPSGAPRMDARGWRACVAVVVLGTAVGAFLQPPEPPPPDSPSAAVGEPPGPSGPGGSAAARDALRASGHQLRELLGGPGEGRLGAILVAERDPFEFLDQFLDPRLELRWRRFLVSLRGWIEDLRPTGELRGRGAAAPVYALADAEDLMARILKLLKFLSARVPAYLTLGRAAMERRQAQAARLEEIATALAQSVEEVLAPLVEADEPELPVLRLAAAGVRYTGSPRLARALLLAPAVALRDPDLAYRRAAWRVLVDAATWMPDATGLSWAQREAVARAAWEDLVGTPDDGGREACALTHDLRGSFLVLTAASWPEGPPAPARALPYLAALEATARCLQGQDPEVRARERGELLRDLERIERRKSIDPAAADWERAARELLGHLEEARASDRDER